MYIVREVFNAKPGMATKMAKLFKKMMIGDMKGRIMTDMVGPYNTVVMEMEVSSMVEWEKQMADHKTQQSNMDPELAKEMEHYHEMFDNGRREIYQIFE